MLPRKTKYEFLVQKGPHLNCKCFIFSSEQTKFMVGLPTSDHNGSWMKVVLEGFCDMVVKKMIML